MHWTNAGRRLHSNTIVFSTLWNAINNQRLRSFSIFTSKTINSNWMSFQLKVSARAQRCPCLVACLFRYSFVDKSAVSSARAESTSLTVHFLLVNLQHAFNWCQHFFLLLFWSDFAWSALVASHLNGDSFNFNEIETHCNQFQRWLMNWKGKKWIHLFESVRHVFFRSRLLNFMFFVFSVASHFHSDFFPLDIFSALARIDDTVNATRS